MDNKLAAHVLASILLTVITYTSTHSWTHFFHHNKIRFASKPSIYYWLYEMTIQNVSVTGSVFLVAYSYSDSILYTLTGKLSNFSPFTVPTHRLHILCITLIKTPFFQRFLSGVSPASGLYWPTFRNILSVPSSRQMIWKWCRSRAC
jgi:hypothetical protein